MKPLPLLTLTFDARIASYDIAAFRHAVIAHAGLAPEMELHPNGSSLPYHYRYPLIQYKRLYRRPAILFIQEGIQAARLLLSAPEAPVVFGAFARPLRLYSIHLWELPIGVDCERWHYYAISSYMALNSHNYRQYMIANSQQDQLQLLEQILANHILAFAKNIGHRLECRFEVQILELISEKQSHFEGFQVLTFDLHFRTQVVLPPCIGLGKAVSIGYGIVRQWQPDHYDF